MCQILPWKATRITFCIVRDLATRQLTSLHAHTSVGWPIENLWSHLDITANQFHPEMKEELLEVVQRAREGSPQAMVEQLVVFPGGLKPSI
jgi:hypothetical protein